MVQIAKTCTLMDINIQVFTVIHNVCDINLKHSAEHCFINVDITLTCEGLKVWLLSLY
jgi:hypothetical protein